MAQSCWTQQEKLWTERGGTKESDVFGLGGRIPFLCEEIGIELRAKNRAAVYKDNPLDENKDHICQVHEK